MEQPISPEVAAVFESYPEELRARLLELRQLILDTAASLDNVGEIEETLKWGEPSYLTPVTKSGSTVRIAPVKRQTDRYAIFFKCTANLVPAFRDKYPTEFTYGGNRSIEFDVGDEVLTDELRRCIALALTYHLNKKLDAPDRWAMVEEQL